MLGFELDVLSARCTRILRPLEVFAVQALVYQQSFIKPAESIADIDRLDGIFSPEITEFFGLFLTGTKFSAADAFFVSLAFRVGAFDLTLSVTAQMYCEKLLSQESMTF